MRTNIEIDDRLMARVMRLTGLPTKRAVVEEGLKLLVQVRKQAQAFKTLRGIGWEGDLDEMRRDQPPGGVVILVDSSVWIAHLRGPWTASTAKLEAAIRREPILVGDHILFEVLQGARDEAHAARIERGLCHFEIVPLHRRRARPSRGEELPQTENSGGDRSEDRGHHHRHVLHRKPLRAATRRSRFRADGGSSRPRRGLTRIATAPARRATASFGRSRPQFALSDHTYVTSNFGY